MDDDSNNDRITFEPTLDQQVHGVGGVGVPEQAGVVPLVLRAQGGELQEEPGAGVREAWGRRGQRLVAVSEPGHVPRLAPWLGVRIQRASQTVSSPFSNVDQALLKVLAVDTCFP